MTFITCTLATVTSAALLAAFAPSEGLAAPPGAQVLASSYAPGADGYSIAEPRVAAM